ncbi:MAG: hypothetical protein HC922_01605 [Leptolyngbyaceae cyanobacterium SM2_3_12]|nr:hypothetical protein [Leptolyngbyaceae cyanobacterium SM2_3_12]
MSPRSELNQLLTTLAPHRYTAQGCLLIEGTDVTQREIYNTLVQLLVGQESVLEPSQFNQANTLMKQLFRADGSLLLSAEKDQAQLFTGSNGPSGT